jgi:hypothetical protein
MRMDETTPPVKSVSDDIFDEEMVILPPAIGVKSERSDTVYSSGSTGPALTNIDARCGFGG